MNEPGELASYGKETAGGNSTERRRELRPCPGRQRLTELNGASGGVLTTGDRPPIETRSRKNTGDAHGAQDCFASRPWSDRYRHSPPHANRMIRTQRGRPSRQDGGARRPAAIPAIRVRPQAGPEPAFRNQRREVTGGNKSNTEVLLVPAMHVFEAHHRRQQAGETRGACLPASQQPTSSPRRGRCSAGRRPFIQCMTRRSE